MPFLITSLAIFTLALSAIAIPISTPDQTGISKFSLSSRSISLKCKPGKGVDTDGICKRCDAGWFSPGGKEAKCNPCAIASYTTKVQSARCRPCPKGREALVAGLFCTKIVPNPPTITWLALFLFLLLLDEVSDHNLN